MIKFIIFDLDGVLVNTKDMHFEALNRALLKTKSSHQISYSDHLKYFDGLPTKEKLRLLLYKKKIFKTELKKIYNLKQNYTNILLKNEIKFDIKLFNLFKKLSKTYKLAIATNSIKKTLVTCIDNLKIKNFLSFAISADEVKKNKPHPEIYLNCLVKTGFKPTETLILEDSYFGRIAAKESGCNLMPIKNLEDISYGKILSFIKKNEKNYNDDKKDHWEDYELNILIPMAGAGSRFEKAGFTFPKPLIQIHNKPMIQWVIESLGIKANYIFIINSHHEKKYNISSMLSTIQKNCKIIQVSKLTEGAACTTLLAKKFINNENPLIIANSDQFIEWNSSKTMYKFVSKKVDGGILVFDSVHPKWSYAKIDNEDYVSEVAEKKVISNNATVGVYYWKKGKDYVKYAEQMIRENIRINNEFYVCPVFNQAIFDNKKIIIEKIKKMWGLGTPEDLSYFIDNYKQRIKND
jgi:HAD superfamily hydrolase (TIGR01509 family)